MTSPGTEFSSSAPSSRAGRIALTISLTLAALAAGGITAAAVCLVVFLLVRSKVGSESPEKHGIAQFPSSRLGGVLVLGYALAASVWLYWIQGADFMLQGYVPAATICVGIFAIGLVEDITGLLPANLRLLLMSALVLPLLWFDASMPMIYTGLPGLDTILSFPLFAYAFSLFGILFLINAANAADGANGLLAGTALIAIWILIRISGLSILVPLWIGLLVFFLINITTGKLFLGDSGAYLVGLVLAVALIYTANGQSTPAWLLMSLVFYPTADFLVSLVRRLCCGGSVMAADNFHFHNMLHAELDRGGWSALWANSLTGLAVVLVWSVPGLVLFEIEVQAVTWAWLYGFYWAAFLAMWLVLYARHKEVAPSPVGSSQ